MCRVITRARGADVAGAAAMIALMLINGGPHVVPITLAAVGVFGGCASVTRKDWRPLAAVLLVAAGGMALAAPKLLPVAMLVGSDAFQDVRNVGVHPDLSTP